MQLSTTFRHMDGSQAVREYAADKLEKIRKYFNKDPISAHAVFSVERGFHHVADLNITLPNGIVINAKETTEDMYSSIDLAAARIERQVRKWKDKIRDHKPHGGPSTSVRERVIPAGELEPQPGAAAETPAGAAQPAAGAALGFRDHQGRTVHRPVPDRRGRRHADEPAGRPAAGVHRRGNREHLGALPAAGRRLRSHRDRWRQGREFGRALRTGGARVMRVTDFLQPDCIVANLAARTKPAVLAELSAHLAKVVPGVEAEALRKVLEERELLASTAIGDGIAIPHGKLDSVGRLIGALGRARRRHRVRVDRRQAHPPHLHAGGARQLDRGPPQGPGPAVPPVS